MRKKRKLKVTAKIFILLILILFIGFLALFVKKQFLSDEPVKPIDPIKIEPLEVPTIIKLNKVTNDTKVEVDSKWQAVIEKYLNSYYESLVKLEVQDASNLFVDPSGVEAYLTNTATKLIVEHHKMQDNDMHLTEALYDIKYYNIKKSGSTVTIDLKRDDSVQFKFLDVKSKTYNMDNTFVLKEVNGEYKIESIRIIQDYYIMFTRSLDFNSSNLKTKIDNLYNTYISNSKKELEKNQKLVKEAGNFTTTKKFDVAFDRTKAREYAIEYVTKRNPNYTAYDNYGGNCMNFASQAMFAGGIPMDYKGSAQWKHYSSTINNSQTASGRTSSWTGTISFYNYAKSNTGFGLVSEVDINLFDAEPGDIAQVGFDGYSHSTIVIDQVKNNEGKVVDILINCNTLSLENYPFLAYVYQNKRVIKVLGYNK